MADGYKCPACGKNSGKIDRNVPKDNDGNYACFCTNPECLGDPWAVKRGSK